MAEMEPNMASMKAEAVRVHNLMWVQKITVTKNVTKCLHLLDLFKKEQNSGSSPLLVQSASEVITFHGRTTDQLSRLKGSTCANLHGGGGVRA